MEAQAQQMASCGRCGKALRVAESRRGDSRPFRLSKTAEGLCADCAMTQFLYSTYPVNMIIDEQGPEMLLNAEFMRQALLSSGVMDPAHCEMDVKEIDWQRVVDNWNLPVKVVRDGRNPYGMGESPRARARKEGLPDPSALTPKSATPVGFSIPGKEQYCPKCSRPCAGAEGRGMFGGYATDCAACGFRSGVGVWIRDIPLPGKAVIQ